MNMDILYRDVTRHYFIYISLKCSFCVVSPHFPSFIIKLLLPTAINENILMLNVYSISGIEDIER